MIICKNCNTRFQDKYCSNCGQKATVTELSMKELLHETWHSVTHTDKGILRLLKDLTLTPKSVYLNYFAGQRKKYFSPVTFFLITAAIVIFMGLKIFDYEDYKIKMFNEYGRFVLSETKFISLLLLPIQILLTTLLFPRQFNLAKNIVFWLYVNGLIFSFQILMTPFYFMFIRQKLLLDNIIELSGFFIIFYHLLLLFGNKKWFNILICFVIVNIILVAKYTLAIYLLFGNKLMVQTHSRNVFEFIIGAYKW